MVKYIRNITVNYNTVNLQSFKFCSIYVFLTLYLPTLSSTGQLFHFVFFYSHARKTIRAIEHFIFHFAYIGGFGVIMDQSRKQLPVVYLNGVHYGGYNNLSCT